MNYNLLLEGGSCKLGAAPKNIITSSLGLKNDGKLFSCKYPDPSVAGLTNSAVAKYVEDPAKFNAEVKSVWNKSKFNLLAAGRDCNENPFLVVSLRDALTT